MDVHSFGQGKAAPGIWINELGTVTKVNKKTAPDLNDLPNNMPDIASTLVCDNYRMHKIAHMHEKDARYRSYPERSGCIFKNCDQFFTFQHSVAETLQYFPQMFGLNDKSQQVLE